MSKLTESNVKYFFRVGKQVFVAVDVCRVNTFYFLESVVDTTAVVQMRAVLELVSVPRCYWQDFDVVLDFAIEKLEKFIEKKGRGNNGGSSVKDEAIALESLGATAKLIQALYYGDIKAHLAGTQGARKSAKTASYDNDVFTHTASTRTAGGAV